MKRKTFFGFVTALAVLISVLLASTLPVQPAHASPSFPGGSTRTANGTYGPVILFEGVGITQSQKGYVWYMGAFDRVDVQYVMVAMSGTNTTTLQLLHSLNNTNWATGATLFSNVLAAGTDITQTFNFGAQTVVSLTLANTNPITVTVLGLFK